MSDDAADMTAKWNARYADSNSPVPPPADVLMRGERWLPESGDALDLACGRGGNALWLASRGLCASAWDLSDAALTHCNLTMQTGHCKHK